MAPTKSQKSQQNLNLSHGACADGGSYTCDSCEKSVWNRGRKQYKCMGNRGKSINDMFKEMAEQEALEHGNFLIIIFPFISWSVDNLSFTAHQLSMMAKEPNNQGQSLSELSKLILPSMFEFFL